MIDNITNNAYSAITAYTTMQRNTANNIANANTEGYSPLDTTMKEKAGGGVTASTSRDSNADRVDLSREALSMMTAENGVKANIAVIRTAQESQKSVIDMKV